MNMQYISDTTKNVSDLLAIVVGIASSLTTIVPFLAAVVSLAWGVIRIYEWWKGKNGNKQLD